MNRRFRTAVATLALAIAALASFAQVPQEYPSGYRKLITSAQREGRVVIYSTMDSAEAGPLIADFESIYPGVEVEYHEMNSPEVYGRFLAETQSKGSSADVTWSSAMDLQIKLANDGFAETYRSPEASSLPDWAVWRDEAYGTTFEPVVIVYNKKLVPPKEVPRANGEFLQLLASRPEKYAGNVLTYDIAKSGVGFLFLSQDSLAMPRFWNLVSEPGARNAPRIDAVMLVEAAILAGPVVAVPVASRSGEVLGGLFFGHSRPGVFTGAAEELIRGVARDLS